MKKLNSSLVGTTILVMTLAGASSLSGNGLRLVSQDAFAAARGEAFAATADNPSAIYYNPAGITQLDGHQIRAGLYGLHFEPTFSPPPGDPNEGRTYHIEDKTAVAPQIFYTYSFEDAPLSLGLGVYAPHGAAVEWPQDTGFRAVATEGELTYLRFNPVIAYQVNRCFSIAGGVMIDYGDISLAQGLTNDDFPNNPEFNNYFEFSGDDIGISYNLGALWQPNQKLSFGATLRSSTTLDFDGETEIFDIFLPGFETAPVTTPASLEYEFPLTAVFGISYRPTPYWNIEINADFTEWSSFDRSVIKQRENTDPIPQNVDVNLDFKDSWIYKVGVTRYLDNGWNVSAGYVFSENSVSESYYNPLVADLDRHFLSLGVGREGDRYSFDASYQYGFSPGIKISGSAPSSVPSANTGIKGADGSYDFTSHALVFSFGMKF